MPEDKRKYLPFRLNSKERRSLRLRRKLARCIMKVEKTSCPRSAKRSDGTYNYKRCAYNPVAVCRAQLEGKRR